MATQMIGSLRLIALTTSRGISQVVVNHGQKQIGYYDAKGWHPTKTKGQQDHPDWVKEAFPSIVRSPQSQISVSVSVSEKVLMACKKMLAEEIAEDAERQRRGESGSPADYTW